MHSYLPVRRPDLICDSEVIFTVGSYCIIGLNLERGFSFINLCESAPIDDTFDHDDSSDNPFSESLQGRLESSHTLV
jgi:hypothetical protein